MSDKAEAQQQSPSSLACAIGSEDTVLSDEDVKSKLIPFLESLGSREDILILPPDFTRFHSQSGKITQFISEHYNFTQKTQDGEEPPTKKAKMPNEKDVSMEEGDAKDTPPKIEILPTLGTHVPMTEEQIRTMFGEELAAKRPNPFLVHDWRNDVVTIGHVPSEMVKDATNGMVDRPWPAQLNKLVWSKRNHNPKTQPHKSLVLSVGQVVPHEVMGMANFNKNLFVGVGGVEAINLSHFIGAVYGMENMMGRASNPLRSILNHASKTYLEKELDLWYILTVMGTNKETGSLEMRGLYIGNDIECYNRACDLSLKVNFTLIEKAPKKVVVYLDEGEYNSTWLGNKAIYRTRMAIADGGELIILAPGVRRFGEDDKVDELIRQYGYVGTPAVMKALDDSPVLKENLSAVAHLIHGSSEGRFSVTYCPGHLTREEIEGVGFKYQDLNDAKKVYDTKTLKDGWNTLKDEENNTEEELYYVSNPALGLWAVQERFDETEKNTKKDTASAAVSVSSKQVASDGSGGVGGWEKPKA